MTQAYQFFVVNLQNARRLPKFQSYFRVLEKRSRYIVLNDVAPSEIMKIEEGGLDHGSVEF